MAARRLTLWLTLALSLLCCGHASASEREDDDPMLDAINDARTHHGLPALHENRSLSRSSASFAGHLMRSNVFAHANRIRASGRFDRLGEVLALHAGSAPRARATVRLWMGSPTHRAVLLSRRFRWLGAGRAVGGFEGRRTTIWVVQVGAL